MFLEGPGLDEIYGKLASTGATSYLRDALGSIVAVSNTSATTTSSYAYSSYGSTAITGTADSPFQYTGRENDAGTNLYYYRARYYSPQLGRFISEDPIELNGGINAYAYADGNPISLTDPNGLFASPWHFGITLIAAHDAGFSWGGSLTIAWYSVTTDIGTQGIDDANIHSMAIGGPHPQSVADARAGSQAYVDSQFNLFTLQGAGNAAHTLADACASGHRFQTWNGGWPSFTHEIGDWFPSYQAVAGAYSSAYSALWQFRNHPF